MTTAYASPGVFTRETDFSYYVKHLTTSACGMIGIAEKGPMNKATLVTSWEQFTKKFGSYIADSYLAYAARSFFDNGGGILYVTRIAHYTDPTDRSTLAAKCSSITLKDRAAGESAVDTLKVSAASEGKWGDNISIVISDGTSNPATEFDITVQYKGVALELFRNLSMDDSKPNAVEMMVNGNSEYITVDDLSLTANAAVNRPATGTFALTTGNDGITGIVDADYIGDPSVHTGLYALDEIADVSILAVPGVTSAPVISAGIAYAESRRDALFIADAPIHLEPLEVVDFRKGKGTYTHAAFDSSYGALYYPWLSISDPLTSNTKLIPPTGAVAGCIARSDEKADVWAAPAGIDRGRIYGVLGLSYNTSRGERDVLYENGVNVIASFPDTGINIWGQKTLQAASSATDRINVRRLMMYVEEAISQSARFVVFEPNNAQTWRALIRLVNPFLSNIKSKGGFYDYRVQCDDETNTAAVIDTNTMVCRIFVKPTKTAEFVELNFVLTTTGADFTEVF